MIELSEAHNYPQGISKAYTSMAMANVYKGELDKAIECADKVVLANNDMDSYAAAYDIKGIVFYYKGDYFKALKHYKKYLSIILKHDEKGKRHLHSAYSNIATVYYSIEDYKEAEKFYHKADEAAQNVKNEYYHAQILVNLSAINITNAKYDDALGFINKAIEIFASQDNHYLLAYSYIMKSEIDLQKGNYDKSLEYAQLAENYNKKSINEPNLASDIKIRYGEVHYEQGKIDQSISYLKDAYQTTIDTERKNKTAKMLLKAYGKKVNDDDINYYLNAYLSFSDSLAKNDNSKKFYDEIKSLELKNLELEKNEEIAQKEFEVSYQKNKKEQYVVLVIIFFMVLIMLSVAYRKVYGHTKALERKNAEVQQQKEAIQIKEQEKSWLLEEIHHRMKNNFQTVSNLLDLQFTNIEDANASKLVEESKDRIRTMTLIHKRLYQNDDLLFEFGTFIEKLVSDIDSTFYKTNGVEVDIDVPNYKLDADTAVPIGLIVNELVTNAYKYGLNNEGAKLTIRVNQIFENYYELIIRDNGQGFPEEFDVTTSEDFGMMLVNSLIDQLEGSFDYTYDNGAVLIVQFSEVYKRPQYKVLQELLS